MNLVLTLTRNIMFETQEIIAVAIIVLAFAFAGYKLYRGMQNPTSGCASCESDCSGCQIADLKEQIEKKQLEKQQESRMSLNNQPDLKDY